MPNRKDESAEENLAEINQKISEIKKKIQLSEGQRKAHFEECDAEKKKNVEKIAALKKEVKLIYRKLAEPSYCKDSILRASNRYPKDVGALRNKKLEEAIVFMDLKCIDLNKRLDIIRYRFKTKKTRLKKLAEEYRDVLMKTSETKSTLAETVCTKPVCVLENQIHRVEMNMMEAEHVNKKYRAIRLQLISDSVEFESSLKKLEEEIVKQETEIKNLQIINKEALGLRDITKGTLLRQEISALTAGKMRENQLQNFRHRVEERKLELEKLERRIFPGGRVMFEEGAEGVQVSQANEGTNRSIAQLESHFAKLKVATGETETGQVLPRFLSQKDTKQRLDFLKRITEEEKKQLEMRKELSLAELEALKFAEVKEKEESQEELEKMNLAIESEKKLKEKHEKEVRRIMDQLVFIGKFFHTLIEQLQEMNEELPPDPSESVDSYMEILNCLMRKIQSGLAKIGFGGNLRETLRNLEKSQHKADAYTEEAWYLEMKLFNRKWMLESDRYTPGYLVRKELKRNKYQHFISDVSIRIPGEETPLFPGLMPQEEGKQAKPQQPSLLVAEEEDEEDVLSRVYVKRQAQLIVDAKSRKKFSRVLNFPKAKK